jgi:glycogen operon protein
MVTLFLSQGVPMFLAGDEFLLTQKGNNNAWCQDNEISWVDWTLVQKNAGFLRFVRELIALRKRHTALRRRGFFRGSGPAGRLAPDITWHGREPGHPDWSGTSRILACSLDGSQTGGDLDRVFYLACNAWREAVPFRIPLSPTGRPWRRVIDTALASPLDIVSETEGEPIRVSSVYQVAPYAALVLISEAER